MARITPTYPDPIPSSYIPKTSITKLPADTPLEYILAITSRDGGIILENLVSPTELTAINAEVKPWSQQARHSTSTTSTKTDAFTIMPSQTIIIPGLVGKSPTAASICEIPILESLRQSILTEKFNVHREDFYEPNRIDPLLSLSMCMNIGYGAPRQRLHRDDNIHGVRHGGTGWGWERVSGFGVLVAGVEVKRENGATMFVPG
jgi:ectoine hydroxylase-related dioxygenase (phytanoyl-CoA dioxygenase family)